MIKNEEKLEQYLLQTLDAIDILYKQQLYGQMLVVMYSAIDSFGLIDSDLSNKKATSHTFQEWVKKYITRDPKLNIEPIDLWGARCGVLHTHTSKSDLSRRSKAKEIQYFSGNRNHPQMQICLKVTPLIDGGKHVAVIIDELVISFCEGLVDFEVDFKSKVKVDREWLNRVGNLLSDRVFPAE